MTLTALAPTTPRPRPSVDHRADQLLTLTARAARAIAVGASALTAPPHERWYTRLQLHHDYDLWLIVWGADAAVPLHDHGTSAGAFSVVAGALAEFRSDGEAGVRAVFPAGGSRAFGSDVRHAVSNPGRVRAVSVHAYSPALTTMTFFDDPRDEPRVEAVAGTEPRW